jgi:hypothetical protein
MIRSEVTDQPVGTSSSHEVVPGFATGSSDVGVRAIVQAGYRFTEGFVVALRASYQGRTINHAGPGAGAAMEYRW